MKQPFVRLFRRKASSLVTTLLVLVVLSTIVVAFLQSMSVERLTAKSLKNMQQAELAARAGFEAAQQQLLLVMSNNPAFVTGLTNYPALSTNNDYVAITLLGRGDLTNSNQIMPLVSLPIPSYATYTNSSWGAALPTYYAVLTNSTNSVNLNGTAHWIQNTSNTNLYRGAWIALTNSAGKSVARYAYIILDEQARLNPIINNGTGTGMTNSTNWYTGPADIQMTNALAQILTPADATSVAALTNVILTPATLAQGFSALTNYENVKHLLTASTNFTYDFIPASLTNGLRAGKGKIDINLAVSNPAAYIAGATDAADTLGKLIFSNLPTFQTRDPAMLASGLSSDQKKYIYRLAANIADYIDTDTKPSLVNGGEPAGKELVPYVTAIAHRYRASTLTASTASIENQCFVQVWNPYTQSIILTNVGFKLKNQMSVSFGTGIKDPFADYDQTVSTNLTVRPNEFVVLKFPTAGPQTWTSIPDATNAAVIGHYTGTSTTPTINVGDAADSSSWPYFQFFVNGNLVDQNRRPPTDSLNVGGLPSSVKTFNDSSDHYQLNFIPTYSGGGGWRSIGDPRATFLTGYDWDNIASDAQYKTNTMWNGRQLNTTNIAKSQEFSTTWFNRDYVPRDPPVGNTPSSTAQLPSDVAPVTYGAAETNSAMAYLRNGPMQSIGELGNVFDPIFGDDTLAAPNGGTPGSVFAAVGGRTLRIGQPEFTGAATLTYNTNGKRAIELLDIFTVNKTNANSQGYPVAIGRVNPNTAPVEVLSSILAGIQITSDAGLTNVTLTNLATLATNIISNRPYGKLSDFYKLTQSFATATNYSPAFTNEIGGGTTNLGAFDRVREEAFGKLVQHFAIQSRTYRIMVIGQTLDVNTGKVKSTSVLESIVYFQPDAAGKFRPITQYQRFLQ
ncbi:hypothetical protein BH09VER1_BH09VER1_41330 [soil metagenome]